jgi:hypothetical protein
MWPSKPGFLAVQGLWILAHRKFLLAQSHTQAVGQLSAPTQHNTHQDKGNLFQQHFSSIILFFTN